MDLIQYQNAPQTGDGINKIRCQTGSNAAFIYLFNLDFCRLRSENSGDRNNSFSYCRTSDLSFLHIYKPNMSNVIMSQKLNHVFFKYLDVRNRSNRMKDLICLAPCKESIRDLCHGLIFLVFRYNELFPSSNAEDLFECECEKTTNHLTPV